MNSEPVFIRRRVTEAIAERVLTARMRITAMFFVALFPGVAPAYEFDFTGSTLTVSTTFASENITINCKANSVHVNGSDTGVACSGVMTLVVNGGSGNNTIDLFGVAAPLAPTTVTVDAAGGNDIIIGTDLTGATETLRGGEGADTIFGGAGDDVLEGGPGADTLNGGPGDDQLIGGLDDDVYRYLVDGGGTDTIVELSGGGTNDRATFASAAGGHYMVRSTGVSRGTDVLEFDGGLERLTVHGDSPAPGKGSDADTYEVFPSPDTIFTISDLGPPPGHIDELIYDRVGLAACPVRVGDSIVSPGQLQPVFFSGIESVNVVFHDCQPNGVEDGCELVDGTSADCGGNGVPDECDPIGDCNQNGADDICEPDIDNDSVIDDCDNCTPTTSEHACDKPGACSNSDQADTDGDGVGDVCDNCVYFCNPDQADSNNNGIGDACELRIGSEIAPPPTGDVPGCSGVSPWITCDCADYTAADFVRTEQARRQQVCINGTNAGCECYGDGDCQSGDCSDSGPSSVDPPATVFFYEHVYNDEGRFFVKEMPQPGAVVTITVQWKDAIGADVGIPVEYFLTSDPPIPAEGDGLEYTLSTPELFSNVVLDSGLVNRNVILDGPFTPSVQYNSVFRECPSNNVVPDFRLSPVIGGHLVELSDDDGTPEGRIVILYSDGLNGSLEGLEVVHVHNEVSTNTPVAVGRQVPVPDPNYCNAVCLQDECNDNQAPGNQLAYQRIEAPLEIWPIQPIELAVQFQVLWFQSTGVGNCWPIDWTRHTSDWPPDPQTYVVDPAAPPFPALVSLPLGEDPSQYCDVELMHQQGLPNPTLAEVIDDTFFMRNPGYAVLRFDRKVDFAGNACSDLPGTRADPRRSEVVFEVVRSYEHLDPFVFEGKVDWDIGRQLEDNEHDTGSPQWPHGYLRDGQPYAPCMYHQDYQNYAGCTETDYTGQIFPVNSGDVHGLLSAWWFEEGDYAPDIYWPHKVVDYNAVWPTDSEPIIIASRAGAGTYPDEGDTKIYHAGVFGGGDSDTLTGWNPNDEHAIILGGKAYAVRDDNPWGVASGHPYVLVQYREQSPRGGEGEPLWRMGVHNVIAEQDPFSFDYSEFPSISDPTQTVQVVAGLPLDPLFPVNLGAAPCTGGDPMAPLTTISALCAGGPNDGQPCECPASSCADFGDDGHKCAGGARQGTSCDLANNCSGQGTCEAEGLWVDRTGVIWASEETDSPAGILIYENWPADVGCQPWRDFGTGEPTPIIYRPSWPLAPPDCNWPNDPTCARPVNIGQTVVDQTNQCGSFTVLHDSAGIKIVDLTYEAGVDFPAVNFPSDVNFKTLPPHLFGGTIGGSLEWPDRIDHDGQTLSFRGIMSVRDLLELRDLSTDTTYRDKLDELFHLTHVQVSGPICTEGVNAGMACDDDHPCPDSQCPPPFIAENEKFVSASGFNTTPGWVVLAFQNDDFCEPVGSPTVQVWRIQCGPDPGFIRPLVPSCPFNEKQVMQHSVDAGGEPENLTYQWQWSTNEDGPWHDYGPPSGPPDCDIGVNCYANGVGLREVIIAGSSPFTLADSWWRVRYRGYNSCACDGSDCNEGTDPWPLHLVDDNSKISDWTRPQLAEGWIKRVLRGLNPFDQRVRDYHTTAINTVVSMIRQAGTRFEAPVALNCTPENINGLGLIEAYETVLGRARLFSIEQGISYDPANLALMLVTSQIVDLYMLLGNEAFADAMDPTVGFFGDTPPADPSAAFCFEGQVPILLEEELALLRGVSNSAPPLLDADGFIIATPYNRLLWNFLPGNNPGRIAYANNYQHVVEPTAIAAYPQGHGDAWGHYLTAIRKFYTLLRHPFFEWVVSTESVLIGGQEPLEVSYQYERKFARVAAAKAKTGAAVTALTFRQLYDADPEQQDGYPDPSTEFSDRKWGVADWARRAGQGAYFDWLVINALVDDDDDDPDHQNTIRKVDRSTILEIGEIVEAYTDIETTLNNAGAGLNPLGLSTAVVPFGLNPNQINSDETHFDQIYQRAIAAMRNAVTVFDWANENTQRLRAVHDDELQITNLNNQREMDFRNRLIETFGRPYPEDVGPGGTYSFDECPDGQCPDIFHFDYVDPSPLTGRTITEGVDTTVYTVGFVDSIIDPITGAGSEEERIITFNVSTNGFGLIKPATWSERPEPGAIQLARSELLQAIGRYETARDDYGGLLANIQTDMDGLTDLYNLNSDILSARQATLAVETTLRVTLVALKIAELHFKTIAEAAKDAAEAAAKTVPSMVIAGFSVGASVGAPAQGAIKAAGAAARVGFLTAADVAEGTAFGIEQAIETANSITDLVIVGWEQDFQARESVRDLEKKLRDESTKRLELFTLAEAIKQAIGKYQSTAGKGLRLLQERVAFRQKTAVQVSQYRYQDMAFRIFRNEALQKYRAQFDLMARYVYLVARAYDYETNLLFSDDDSGRQFLTDIVKERVLGKADCNPVACNPLLGNGLAGRLRDLKDSFEVARVQLGFNSPSQFDRTFSLRWELFRIPNTPSFDADWRAKLESFREVDLNTMQEYNLFALPLQGGPATNPALVIEFSTFVQAGHNFFGLPSTGDETLPSDRFAIKIHEYGVRFADYPGAPLNNQVNVYLIPVGADTLRVPQCPDAPIRVWQLIDQTLPIPLILGDEYFDTPSWQPWDALDGGAAALVQRRLIPTVAACPASEPFCDSSVKLTGRSIWNSRWMLIIPGSELEGADPVDGIDVFIGDANNPGVSDIKLLFTSYGYSGCAVSAEADGELEPTTPLIEGANER